MDLTSFVLLCLLSLILRPLIEEFRTIVQIIKNFFSPPKDLKRLYGPWAVVTGSTDGIGKNFALELAERGFNMVLISRNPEKLKATAEEIESKFKVETKIIVADFKQGRPIYRKIQEELDELDVGILVNNVGISYSSPMQFGDLPEDEIWDLLNVNVGSVLQMTRIVLPQMVRKNQGAVINMSSGSKLQPLPFWNLYAASKIYVDYFTEALRHEYQKSNITIQSLCPYFINTKIVNFKDQLSPKYFLVFPSPQRYVKAAISTLGNIDNTTGYWPHRFQYMLAAILPTWVKVHAGASMYKLAVKDPEKIN